MLKKTLLATVLAMTAGHASAATTNLITNGDFDTDLNGWTCVIGNDAYCGTWGHFVGWENEGFGTLSQTFATTAKASYRLSFQGFTFLTYPGNIIRYVLGDADPVEAIPTTSWTEYVADFTASGPTTTLTFQFETDSGTGVVAVDNVSVIQTSVAPPVAPVPLPAAGLMLVGALGGLGALARRKRTA